MPLATPAAWSRVATRALLVICGFVLLATTLAVTPAAGATGLGDRISANRASQLYAERAMRTQDAVLAQVKRDLKGAKKDFKRAKRDHKRTKRTLQAAALVVRERKSRLASVEGEYSDPSEAPPPDAYLERLQQIRRDVRVAERRKRILGRRTRATSRVVHAKRARLSALKRARGSAIAGRESAEAALGGRIVEMTRLAAERADNQAAVSLYGQGSFSWPTTGRISQPYGCTGFHMNPRRGSCRHFHDGIDVVDGYGTPVRAVAVGVVAFVGWNPWDEGGRAWIVVVAHPDGYVSRYGHLTPTDRVRAGELVHTGQVIGKMGNTGNSTGTHLHFELLRGGRDVDPVSYLPAGVIRIDKTSTRQGERALKAKQKARQRARAKARDRREARMAAGAGESALTVADDACAPLRAPESIEELDGDTPDALAAAVTDCLSQPGPADTVDDLVLTLPAQPSTRPQPAAAATPGVPLPKRGTSPVPA